MFWKQHHRNVKYRPPRPVLDSKRSTFGHFLEFLQRYALPHWKPLSLAMFLVCLNGCSVYLMAFYGRYVIDDILVISSGAIKEKQVWREGRVVVEDQSRPGKGRPVPRDRRAGLALQ